MVGNYEFEADTNYVQEYSKFNWLCFEQCKVLNALYELQFQAFDIALKARLLNNASSILKKQLLYLKRPAPITD